MAESRIVKARLNDEYQNKMREILLKFNIDPAEKGSDTIALRVAIDLAVEQLRYLPKDVVEYYYRTVSQAYQIQGKKRKRRSKKSIYDIEPEEMTADDWGT